MRVRGEEGARVTLPAPQRLIYPFSLPLNLAEVQQILRFGHRHPVCQALHKGSSCHLREGWSKSSGNFSRCGHWGAIRSRGKVRNLGSGRG